MEHWMEGVLSTAAFDARGTGRTSRYVRDRPGCRGMRVASAVAVMSVLHAGVFVPFAREPVAPVRARQRAHDALASPRPVPFATVVERREVVHHDAASGTTQTQAAA
ncbi:hypothetical protein [Burkholderia sp. Ac-20349]|uniref:hypothetical protein n=1 Tax=Burkholderia sp. Ac-20349 TaxID=2703893 RepID=UPI00197C3034|nr:hypothetical protein [Burkholderia sp. Ac-20349]MBN3840501.1 hypothetical protein [Burkholderia sp. Ac-20349]